MITKAKKMKDAWYLASNCTEKKTKEIINLYGRRWKIEPNFRDIKDQRFGLGLSNTHIFINQHETDKAVEPRNFVGALF